MSEFTLAVNGSTYAGWVSVRVARSLSDFASSFELTYHDRWAELDTPRPIQIGDACVVSFGSFTLITGWIDAREREASSDSLQITAAGRSRTGDLVDCSIVHAGQWRNQTLAAIVRGLIEPFGISLAGDPEVLADAHRFARFEFDDGDTPYDAIDRLCRARGCVPLTLPDGSLSLRRLSRTSGLRIARLDMTQVRTRRESIEAQDRFSEYRLRGLTARVDATESPRRAALQNHRITDTGVRRYRPRVLTSDSGARLAELQDQALWERNQRAGNSHRYTYQITGVLAPDGSPWEPAMLVWVDDPEMGVRDTLLVNSVTHECVSDDVFTRIELSAIDAYSIAPLSERQLRAWSS